MDCQEYRGFPYNQLCGLDLDGQETDSHGLPLVPTTLCGRMSTGGELALKDLRGTGGEASAAPGATAKVPFTLRYVGDAGPSFALSASTALPGAAVSPSPAVLTPAAPGFQDATVTVAVPAGTAPGAYAVTLTATVGGQTRTAQGTVRVTAPAGMTATSGSTQETDDGAEVAGAGTVATPPRKRLLEFRGFDRSGVGPGRQVHQPGRRPLPQDRGLVRLGDGPADRPLGATARRRRGGPRRFPPARADGHHRHGAADRSRSRAAGA